MNTLRKTRALNLFCKTCDKHLSELYITRHLKTRSHKTKLKRSVLRDSKTSSTPDKQINYTVQGETLKKCSHEHSNMFEGCSELYKPEECRRSPDIFDKVKQRLFEKEVEEQAIYQMDVPQTYDFVE